MSDTIASLRRKIGSAGALRSVVRTMKAMAASSIGHYERSVLALADYSRTVELGLGASIRAASLGDDGTTTTSPAWTRPLEAGPIVAIVFGSDQGLVGRFNDVVAADALEALSALPGEPTVWAVGERVHARLADAGLPLAALFAVPASVEAITGLVGRILVESEALQRPGTGFELHLFYNRPGAGEVYAPVRQRLLPLDDAWSRGLAERPWPTNRRPEILGGEAGTLRALVREHLFVSLFRACAESLSSENASRLAAMQRAERNIEEVLEGLEGTSRRLRQSGIDQELFDVISGYEALSDPPGGARPHRAGRAIAQGGRT